VIRGPIVLVGHPDGLNGASAMAIVDGLLEYYSACHLMPWPGREPDEQTIRD
jgi:hypothetical protein